MLIERVDYCRTRNKLNGTLPEFEHFRRKEVNTSCPFESCPDEKRNLKVLQRQLHQVSGKGFECKRERIDITWNYGFWGSKEKSFVSTFERFSETDCRMMLATKQCNGKPMVCEKGQGCFLADIPEDNYWWPTRTFGKGYRCQLSEKYMQATDKTVNMFTLNKNECRAIDGYCVLHESVVIWNLKDIIHDCPFVAIDEFEFELVDDNLLISKKENFQFEVIGKHAVCQNLTAYSTTEGLYLMKGAEAKSIEFETDSSEKYLVKTKLMLAEKDATTYQNIRIMQEMNMRACVLFANTMTLFANSDDTFFSVMDANGNQLTIYSHAGEVYIPNCEQVSNVYIIKHTEHCYQDVPVNFFYNGQNHTGFLTSEKVIRRISKIIECDLSLKYFIINENIAIHKVGRDTQLVENKIIKRRVNLIQGNIAEFNFIHYGGLTEDVDITEDFRKLSSIKEAAGDFLVSVIDR